MKVTFKGGYIEDTYHIVQSILTIGGFTISDDFNVDYDELDGKKRIIITKEKNGNNKKND
tara:strand:+ start:751 stop:930 length:180 start_codon:yes stop_codon:yes gene_type:complete